MTRDQFNKIVEFINKGVEKEIKDSQGERLDDREYTIWETRYYLDKLKKFTLHESSKKDRVLKAVITDLEKELGNLRMKG